MSSVYDRSETLVVITTSVVALITGFLLGVYSIRGYLISPELHKESRANYDDPVDSDETDIDEEETVLDHAPNWANGEVADRKQGLRVTAAGKKKGQQIANVETGAEEEEEAGSGSTVEDTGEECKLVLVVRTDLGMTKGKIAAQCSHATLACYKSISRESRKAGPKSAAARILSRWERYGQAKVAVQVKTLDEMKELMGVARSLGITSEVIQDAGRTQIDPGSLTVLGVGPAPKSKVDQVTGGLKLL
ncbi:peptidyl-tRNA hydrolase PTH2-domain-containing protein [Coniella lustricola]|uniref:peptidyl-tRNA hydrolase n=1 Tax=Coniella lustricola TaxID=2025994 RepID=A0A2T3A837_9PEZI|nr:peptidyl-tRNA hydrolase PTH2-domain-containing protein [Coniella lustricola]